MLKKGKIGTNGILRNRSGVAAVEFALILPLMLLLYIGVIDVSRGVIASRKLNLLSRTIADLVSQQPTAVATPISKLQTIFAASTAVMAPFNTTSLKMTVSAVNIQAKSGGSTCCDAVVKWSFTQSGTLRACSTLQQVADGTAPTPTNFPSSLVTANQTQGYGYTSGASSFVIVADASFVYTPFFLQAVQWFSSGMNKTTFMVPRSSSGQITIASPSGVAAPQSGAICS